jgi:hypothetical protein
MSAVPVFTPQLQVCFEELLVSLEALKNCIVTGQRDEKVMVNYGNMVNNDFVKYKTLLATINAIHEFEEKYPVQ